MRTDRAFRQVESSVLRHARQEAWEEQGQCCRYCLAPLKFSASTADHVVPRSKGGTNARKNIVAACVDCNSAKGSWTVLAFKHAIKKPEHGMPTKVWLSWARRRIWLATHRANRRVRYAVGLDNDTPVGLRPATSEALRRAVGE